MKAKNRTTRKARQKEIERVRAIEAESARFVLEIFENTKSDLFERTPKECIGILNESGYARKGKLVGYAAVERYIERLSDKQMKMFFKIFLNHAHQAAYH